MPLPLYPHQAGTEYPPRYQTQNNNNDLLRDEYYVAYLDGPGMPPSNCSPGNYPTDDTEAYAIQSNPFRKYEYYPQVGSYDIATNIFGDEQTNRLLGISRYNVDVFTGCCESPQPCPTTNAWRGYQVYNTYSPAHLGVLYVDVSNSADLGVGQAAFITKMYLKLKFAKLPQNNGCPPGECYDQTYETHVQIRTNDIVDNSNYDEIDIYFNQYYYDGNLTGREINIVDRRNANATIAYMTDPTSGSSVIETNHSPNYETFRILTETDTHYTAELTRFVNFPLYRGNYSYYDPETETNVYFGSRCRVIVDVVNLQHIWQSNVFSTGIGSFTPITEGQAPFYPPSPYSINDFYPIQEVKYKAEVMLDPDYTPP